MDESTGQQQKPQGGGWYPSEAILYAISILVWLILLTLLYQLGIWLGEPG